MTSWDDEDRQSESHPRRLGRRAPRVATALLDRLAPGQEAMTGDLLEGHAMAFPDRRRSRVSDRGMDGHP